MSDCIASGIQPIQVMGRKGLSFFRAVLILCLLQNLSVLKYVGTDKKAEWGRYWIEQGFNGEGA